MVFWSYFAPYGDMASSMELWRQKHRDPSQSWPNPRSHVSVPASSTSHNTSHKNVARQIAQQFALRFIA